MFTVNDKIAEQLFGCNSFPFAIAEGDWLISKNSEDVVRPTVYHGTTLCQLREILASNVWKAGLHHEPTLTSPLSVWVTTSRAISLV